MQTASPDEIVKTLSQNQDIFIYCTAAIVGIFSVLIGVLAARAFNFWKW
ncbi:MAG: hypothetical protein IJV39_01085 [Ruminococcus sp.]|nr:hypothetical protein [Ruminococcus sp.]